MSSYLLRVQLEDRPGSLGSLAIALGTAGADILSLDVVERGSGYAIDDIVVDLPAGAMPDSLITATEAFIETTTSGGTQPDTAARTVRGVTRISCGVRARPW